MLINNSNLLEKCDGKIYLDGRKVKSTIPVIKLVSAYYEGSHWHADGRILKDDDFEN